MDHARLPHYQSHKIVRAARITDVGDQHLEIEWGSDGAMERLPVNDSKLYARYRPVPGDYYVVYEDDYVSISPKKAFEDGYSLMPSLDELRED